MPSPYLQGRGTTGHPLMPQLQGFILFLSASELHGAMWGDDIARKLVAMVISHERCMFSHIHATVDPALNLGD